MRLVSASFAASLAVVLVTIFAWPVGIAAQDSRPNIVFAIADDWGWPHAGYIGDAAVKTPTFDGLAVRGVHFENAFVSSPSCTPSRGAIITGQHFWRLKAGANLHPNWPDDQFPEFPRLLSDAGYHVGHYRKAWGPGRADSNPSGKRYRSVDAFFDSLPDDTPFCFWFGSSDPHRGYEPGSGAEAGINLRDVHLFPFFPDTPEVRNDVADYYFEVQRFDREVGELVAKLDEDGLLDNTIIVMTSDHGMPFPRCKGNVYDSGARVPLVIAGPGIPGGRILNEFISLTDIAPTFLDVADVSIPKEMTGNSMMPLLESSRNGMVDESRDHVFFGRERHVIAQEAPQKGGYPVRAIRTFDFLYIKNFEPDRWPAGSPNWEKAAFKKAWLADCDNGPTKTAIWERRNDPEFEESYQLCFGKRPAEELYDLRADGHQLKNVAGEAEYAKIQKELSAKLMAELERTGDPRVKGQGEFFDTQPYHGGAPQWQGK